MASLPDVVCPVCGSHVAEPLEPRYTGPCVTSDLRILSAATLDNRCCRDCGLVFNAAGTRKFHKDFYESSYSLMMSNSKSVMWNFSGASPVGQPALSLQILTELVSVGSYGKILEIGAGKGDFLLEFLHQYPRWTALALEPSASFNVLKERLPHIVVGRRPFDEANLPKASMTIIAILGVLEHVENPLYLLQWAHQHLVDNGYLYVRVPDFANNPNDLFCADHLSKLTVPTLQHLAARCGFKVRGCRHAGVPVFMVFEKTAEDLPTPPSIHTMNMELACRNWIVAKSSIDSVLEARVTARSQNEPFAIFGLGPAGLFAPFYGGFECDEISAFLDENDSLWGSRVLGRIVGGMDLIDELNIRHIAVPISPVYVKKIERKLKALRVSVYTPKMHASWTTNARA